MNFHAIRLQPGTYSCPSTFTTFVLHYLWDQDFRITLSVRPTIYVQFATVCQHIQKLLPGHVCSQPYTHPPWLHKFHFLSKPDWKQDTKPENSKLFLLIQYNIHILASEKNPEYLVSLISPTCKNSFVHCLSGLNAGNPLFAISWVILVKFSSPSTHFPFCLFRNSMVKEEQALCPCLYSA